MLTWPTKDPNEVLDYKLDWTLRLESGETIVTSTWTVASGDVTIDSDSTGSGITTVWLSAGTDGTPCELLNRVVTSGGRTYDQTVKLRIRSH